MRIACPRAMRHLSNAIPREQSCASFLWSFSMSQGLHLHVSDPPRDPCPKSLRRYDFRLLAPSTVSTCQRRGHEGMPSSVTQASSSLVACGKQCILSLRPERCASNKVENKKSQETEESVRDVRITSNTIMDKQKKTGEEKKRAQSGVARSRMMQMPDARPSTAPAHIRAEPGYRMGLRTSENGHHNTDRTSAGNPVLHLYLPNYPSEPRKDANKVLEVAADRQDANTDGKIQTGEQLDVKGGAVRCEAAGGNRTPDAVDDVITMEIGCDQKDKMEKDGKRRRSSRNELIEKEDTKKKTQESTREPSKEHSTEEQRCAGKSGDTPDHTAAVTAPQLKCARIRNSETVITRRLTLPAPALSFPGMLARTNSSPSPPLLYGSTLGSCIRTPHVTERHQSKNVGFDKRPVKPKTERLLSSETRETRWPARGITASHPKWWSSLPRQTKTTKTFMWGPWGPQETKSVCELHTRTGRWTSSDYCHGSGDHAPTKTLAVS